MDIKAELEIKQEELDFEHLQQDSEKSSNSKNEIFFIENIKEEPEEEPESREQYQHKSNEEKLFNYSKSSNSKNEIFLIEIKEEPEKEPESKEQFQHKSNEAKLFNYSNLLDGYRKSGEKSPLQIRSQESRIPTTVTGNERFRCFHCNYESDLRSTIEVHVKQHIRPKVFIRSKAYQCSECHYESNQKQNLISHMLTHENIKLLKCSEFKKLKTT